MKIGTTSRAALFVLVPAIATRATPIVVLPTHTRLLSGRPLRSIGTNRRPCENATAIHTVTLFQTKKTKAATASAIHVRGDPRATWSRPVSLVITPNTTPASRHPVAADVALKTTFTRGRRASRWAVPIASGATSRSHGDGSTTRPTMTADSDQVNEYLSWPKRMCRTAMSPKAKPVEASASFHVAGTCAKRWG